MQFDHLRALAAVVDQGTLEKAAARLGVTPSAVSQRIRALESSVGGVVVRRQSPCTATALGDPILRLARQVMTLEAETRRELQPSGSRSPLPVAVNADSLATWFLPVLEASADWPDASLRLHVEDQEHTLALLRSGAVTAALTVEPHPVAGCSVERLGVMRYHPVAHPDLVARHRTGRGGVDWATLPVLRFNAKDAMQSDLLDRLAPGAAPPMAQVPDSTAFALAVRAGVGWGMQPEAQLGDALTTGDLVLLHRRAHLDVELHWQRWRISSPTLDRLTDTVRYAARHLRPGQRVSPPPA
jgi:LysR family transcriptional regulator (chromosome initiation inhibitor)